MPEGRNFPASLPDPTLPPPPERFANLDGALRVAHPTLPAVPFDVLLPADPLAVTPVLSKCRFCGVGEPIAEGFCSTWCKQAFLRPFADAEFKPREAGPIVSDCGGSCGIGCHQLEREP